MLRLLLQFLTVSLLISLSVQQTSFDGWIETTAPENYYASVTTSGDGSVQGAVVTWGDNNGVFVSTNGGVTWSRSSAPLASWSSISANTDASVMAAVEIGYGVSGSVYISNNRGLSWRKTNVPVGLFKDVAVSADGKTIIALVVNGGIYVSTDVGNNWKQSSVQSNGWIACAISDDGVNMAAVDYGAGGGTGGGLWQSSDRGVTWIKNNRISGDQFWRGVALSNNGQVVAGVTDVNGNVFVSTDGGGSWKISDLPNGDWRGLTMSSDGKMIAACAYYGVDGAQLDVDGGVYVSFDTGETWAATSASNKGTWASISTNTDGTKIVAVANGKVYISYKDGVTPPPSVQSSGGPTISLTVAPFQEGHVVGGVFGGIIATLAAVFCCK